MFALSRGWCGLLRLAIPSKRNLPAHQRRGDGIDRLAVEVSVEDRSCEGHCIDGRERLIDCRHRLHCRSAGVL